jgi:hypothetical protein
LAAVRSVAARNHPGVVPVPWTPTKPDTRRRDHRHTATRSTGRRRDSGRQGRGRHRQEPRHHAEPRPHAGRIQESFESAGERKLGSTLGRSQRSERPVVLPSWVPWWAEKPKPRQHRRRTNPCPKPHVHTASRALRSIHPGERF